MKKFIIIAALLATVLHAKCYTVCGQDGCKIVCITDDLRLNYDQ